MTFGAMPFGYCALRGLRPAHTDDEKMDEAA